MNTLGRIQLIAGLAVLAGGCARGTDPSADDAGVAADASPALDASAALDASGVSDATVDGGNHEDAGSNDALPSDIADTGVMDSGTSSTAQTRFRLIAADYGGIGGTRTATIALASRSGAVLLR